MPSHRLEHTVAVKPQLVAAFTIRSLHLSVGFQSFATSTLCLRIRVVVEPSQRPFQDVDPMQGFCNSRRCDCLRFMAVCAKCVGIKVERGLRPCSPRLASKHAGVVTVAVQAVNVRTECLDDCRINSSVLKCVRKPRTGRS